MSLARLCPPPLPPSTTTTRRRRGGGRSEVRWVRGQRSEVALSRGRPPAHPLPSLPQGRAMLRAPCPLGPPHGRLLLPDAAAAALRLLPPLPGVSRHGEAGGGRLEGMGGATVAGRGRGGPRCVAMATGTGLEGPGGPGGSRWARSGGRSALWGYGRGGPAHLVAAGPPPRQPPFLEEPERGKVVGGEGESRLRARRRAAAAPLGLCPGPVPDPCRLRASGPAGPRRPRAFIPMGASALATIPASCPAAGLGCGTEAGTASVSSATSIFWGLVPKQRHRNPGCG